MLTKLLIVDDDSLLTDTLKRFLEQKEFEVFTANSGSTGIELARQLFGDREGHQ